MKGKKAMQGGRPSCAKVLYAALVPFLFAIVTGLLFFQRGDQGNAVKRTSRGVLQQAAAGCTGLCCGGDCAQAAELAGSRLPELPSSALAAASTSDDDVLPAAKDLPKLFMFVGILSGRGYRHRRLAVREAWSNRAQVAGTVVSKFILSEDERTPQVQKELEMYNDIVFVKEKTNYKSILFKTFYVMEYAVKHYDVKFVLKTDDDAFINVLPMMEQLRMLCENKNCERERLYLGKMAMHSEVLLQPGHKWNNAVFHNHTGLKVYPNYMMGGGYVISGEVSRVLVDVHSRMRLKFTPIEDATLGFWLMNMDLRHIDHPKFYTWAAPCCFKAPVRKAGQRIVTRFQLADEFESDLCGRDPWLVLHKIDSPTKMRYVGARVANCTAVTPGIAPSIEAYVPAETKAFFAQQQQRLQGAGGSTDSSSGKSTTSSEDGSGKDGSSKDTTSSSSKDSSSTGSDSSSSSSDAVAGSATPGEAAASGAAGAALPGSTASANATASEAGVAAAAAAAS